MSAFVQSDDTNNYSIALDMQQAYQQKLPAPSVLSRLMRFCPTTTKDGFDKNLT
jgi:hypothetical protein